MPFMLTVLASLSTPFNRSPETLRISMQFVLLFSQLLLLPKLSAIVVLAQAAFDTNYARAEERNLALVSAAHQLAVQLPGQSENTAKEVAERYGLKFITKVDIFVITIIIMLVFSASYCVYSCSCR